MNTFFRNTLFVFLFTSIFLVHSVVASQSNTIYFFYGTGCPHCANVEEYFQSENLYEKYHIEKREIYFNRENAVLFNNLLTKLNVPQNERGVPTVVIGDKILMGDTPIIQNFINEADTVTGKADKHIPQGQTDTQLQQGFQLTFLAVVAGAIVDAINPCAFAVLILLMTTILASGNRKKALYSGLAFAVSIFISYYLMGLGLYQALGAGSTARIFYQIVGWLAIILALFNFKDYFWYGKGILMEVPMSWRPRLKKLISSVTNPIGAFFIGFLVSLFLLPCTSGPYIVILGMLAQNTLYFKAIMYLFLYNLIFILPMIFITLAVYAGYSPKRAEEIRQKHLKTLHLIGGIILLMMGLAIVMNLV